MKIKSVHIDSFGAVRGYNIEFDKGNIMVFYGENEAGKSTISEFIRGTIFNGKNAKYPVQHKTDKGYVEIEMENGETRHLVREGRRVFERDGKTMPSDILKMDAETYRSLFSFDIDQIGDDRMISNGDFRKKFLTVPGGEHVPEVSRSIESSMATLSSKERLTEARELGKLKKKLREVDEQIALCNERTEEYNDMVAQKEKLERDLENAKLLQDRELYETNKAFMFESLKENTEKLDELMKRRKEISYVEALTDEDIRKYDELRTRLVTIESLIESGVTDEDADEEMSAEEVNNILSMKDEIEKVSASRSRMEILEGTIKDLTVSMEKDAKTIGDVSDSVNLCESDMERIVSDPEIAEVLCNPDNKKVVSKKFVGCFSKAKRAVCSAIGIAGAVASAYFGLLPLSFILLTVVFLLNLVPTFVQGYCRVDNVDWPVWLESKGFTGKTTEQEALQAFQSVSAISYVIDRHAQSKQRLEEFEAEMESLTTQARDVVGRMKIGSGFIFRDISEMEQMYSKAKEFSNAFSESDGLVDKRESIKKEFDELVGKYGGETAFVDMRIVLDEYKSLNIRIKELEDAIKSATAASNEIMNKFIDDVNDDSDAKIDPSKLIDEINLSIGELTREMKHIVNDDDLSQCLITKGTVEKEFKNALRQWAVYAVADHIITECCDRFYSQLQPAVVKTANKYLETMTDGKYSIGSNPRDDSLFIEDRRKNPKHDGEWSSGLKDQVFLSIKLAIAKEMGSERLPIIIDDVLVRFDNRRKEEACKALVEFSEDQQVIMFTCDSSLESMFRRVGMHNWTELR